MPWANVPYGGLRNTARGNVLVRVRCTDKNIGSDRNSNPDQKEEGSTIFTVLPFLLKFQTFDEKGLTNETFNFSHIGPL